MNTAARLEHLGKAGRIHVSSETAELLAQAGKVSWVMKREDAIEAKGKPAILNLRMKSGKT